MEMCTFFGFGYAGIEPTVLYMRGNALTQSCIYNLYFKFW